MMRPALNAAMLFVLAFTFQWLLAWGAPLLGADPLPDSPIGPPEWEQVLPLVPTDWSPIEPTVWIDRTRDSYFSYNWISSDLESGRYILAMTGQVRTPFVTTSAIAIAKGVQDALSEKSPITISRYGWPCRSHYIVTRCTPDCDRRHSARVPLVGAAIPLGTLWLGAIGNTLAFLLLFVAIRRVAKSSKCWYCVRRGRCPDCAATLGATRGSCPACDRTFASRDQTAARCTWHVVLSLIIGALLTVLTSWLLARNAVPTAGGDRYLMGGFTECNGRVMVYRARGQLSASFEFKTNVIYQGMHNVESQFFDDVPRWMQWIILPPQCDRVGTIDAFGLPFLAMERRTENRSHVGSWQINPGLRLPLIPCVPGFAFNSVVFGFIAWPYFGIARLRRYSRGVCPRCKHDLRYEYGDGCAECGWRRS